MSLLAKLPSSIHLTLHNLTPLRAVAVHRWNNETHAASNNGENGEQPAIPNASYSRFREQRAEEREDIADGVVDGDAVAGFLGHEFS